jgi:hypothetical protein
MSKKLAHNYVFTPSTDTIVLDGMIDRERLLLITNVTDGITMFTFNDTVNGILSHSVNRQTRKTTIVLNYDCALMSATDKIQIFWEDDQQTIRPEEALVDPVHKWRISAPENLIDTDFEYGLQGAKWETVELSNNIPSFFGKAADSTLIGITRISTLANSNLITVTVSDPHRLAKGSPIDVGGLSSLTAEGKYLVNSVIDTLNFTYKARTVQSVTANIKTPYTTVLPGQFYAGSDINYVTTNGISTNALNPSTLTVQTPTDHGFAIGSNFYLINSVSPKTLSISTTGNSIAPDGLPYVDFTDTESATITPDLTLTETKAVQGAYYLKFNASAVSVASSTITWVGHNLRENDVLLYNKPAGVDGPLDPLVNLNFYYVTNPTANTFQLKLTSGGTPIIFQNAGTYNGGRGEFMLSYEIYYSYSPFWDNTAYFYTWSMASGSGSGWDLQDSSKYKSAYSASGGYVGLMGRAPDYFVPYFRGTNNGFVNAYNYLWYNYGVYYSTTYSGNMGTDPHTTYPKSHNFVEDWTRYSSNNNFKSPASNNVLIWNQNVIYHYNNHYYYTFNSSWYFSRGEMFFVPLNDDPETDSFYALDHGFVTGQSITFSTSGPPVYYYTHGAGDFSTSFTPSTLAAGSYTIERVSSSRFRIRSGSTPIRISAANGSYTFAGSRNRLTRNTFYVSKHGLVDNNILTVTAEAGAVLPSTTTGAISYTGSTSNFETFYKIIASGIEAWLSTQASTAKLFMDGPNNSQPFLYGAASDITNFQGGWSFYSRVYDNQYGYWYPSYAPGHTWDTGQAEDFGRGTPVAFQGHSIIMPTYVKDRQLDYYLVMHSHPLNRYAETYFYMNHSSNYSYSIDQVNVNTTPPFYTTTTAQLTDWRYTRIAQYWQQAGRDQIIYVQMKIRKESWDPYGYYNQTSTYSTYYAHLYNFAYNMMTVSFLIRVPSSISVNATYLLNLDKKIMDTLYSGWTLPSLTSGTNYKAKVVNENRFSLNSTAGVEIDITNVGTAGPQGQSAFTVTNNGSTNWVINHGTTVNPNLFLKKGYTYSFTVAATGHPFYIKTLATSGTADAYNTGVTNNGTEGGTIIFAVPLNAPDTLYYVCANHAGAMGGTISTVTDPATISMLDVTNQFGALDGVYTTTAVTSSTSFDFGVAFKAGKKTLQMVKLNQDTNNYFKFTGGHYLANGTPVVYNNNGNADLPSFSNGSTYYVIIADETYIKLASSLANYNNATGIDITWSAVPTSTHLFTSSTVNGMITSVGSVAVTNGSSVVKGSDDSLFLTYYKPGDIMYIKNNNITPGALLPFAISSVVSDTSLALATPCTFTAASTTHLIPTKLYVRPDGATAHRPFDGGVEIQAGTAPNSQIVRQTRKYFRYQSGKGIQISLAINFNPPIAVETIAAVTDVKCERDVGYIVDGARYDVATGSTYNAVFIGIAETNSKYLNPTVTARILRAKAEILALPAVAADATAISRINAYFTEITTCLTNGRTAASNPTFANPSTATASQIAAKDKLLANLVFIEDEINAYVALTYPSYDHDVTKCTRDVKYAVRALCFDILYGGNFANYTQARFFNYALGAGDGNTTGIAASHRLQTVAAYDRLKVIVGQIVQGIAVTKTTTGAMPNTSTQVTSGNNASSGDATIVQNLVQITTDVVNYGLGTPGLGTYTKTAPTYSWATAGLQAAATAIGAAKATLQETKAAQITTKYPHGISAGQRIVVNGAANSEYNGSNIITVVADPFTLQYSLADIPTTIAPGGVVSFNIDGWQNAETRCGLFDFQNGFYFAYDGSVLYCVRRNSTTQLSGTITATKDSNQLLGTNTNFIGQLAAGDRIVVRGQTYKVVSITGKDSMIVQPKYKGTTATGIIATKTQDLKIPQSQWNIDICDGNGASNFLLDKTKIQMAYMDYSWYGAGKIRFGFKDTYGHVIYVHEFIHNNLETEAYMRSGNLPARYEVENTGTATYQPKLFHWGTSVIMDGRFDNDKAYLFTAASDTLTFTNGQTATATTNAASQLVYFYNPNKRNYDWYVQLSFATSDAAKFSTGTPLYTADNQLKGQTVNQAQYSGSNYLVRIYITTQNFFPTGYPTIGSGVVVNIGVPAAGDTSGLLFNDIPLISIRLSPSVDNGVTGNVGERDIINRMQLQLQQAGLVLTHDCEVTLILNPSLSNINWTKVTSPSLSNLVNHTVGDTVVGGTKIYSFRAQGGGQTGGVGTKRLNNVTNIDLSQITDMGNCILGGDGVFPNGPDLLTLAVKVINSSEVNATVPFNCSARITWSESQA